MKISDISGRVFGYLTVVRRHSSNTKYGKALWVCSCICGKETIVSGNALLKKNTTSCGCYRALVIRTKGKNVKECSGLSTLFDHYKRNAVKKGLTFSLSLDQFKSITSGRCSYCGIPPFRSVKSRRGYSTYTYNGIDRINNDLGYINNNCSSCCSICNHSKSNMTLSDFMDWVSRTAHFNLDKLSLAPIAKV